MDFNQMAKGRNAEDQKKMQVDYLKPTGILSLPILPPPFGEQKRNITGRKDDIVGGGKLIPIQLRIVDEWSNDNKILASSTPPPKTTPKNNYSITLKPPIPQAIIPGIRKGLWTTAEEDYAKHLMDAFVKGRLDVIPGTTLRSYLAKKLNCAPMRISKKFAGEDRIGKIIFEPHRDSITDAMIKTTEHEMNLYSEIFQASIMLKRIDSSSALPVDVVTPEILEKVVPNRGQKRNWTSNHPLISETQGPVRRRGKSCSDTGIGSKKKPLNVAPFSFKRSMNEPLDDELKAVGAVMQSTSHSTIDALLSGLPKIKSKVNALPLSSLPFPTSEPPSNTYRSSSLDLTNSGYYNTAFQDVVAPRMDRYRHSDPWEAMEQASQAASAAALASTFKNDDDNDEKEH